MTRFPHEPGRLPAGTATSPVPALAEAVAAEAQEPITEALDGLALDPGDPDVWLDAEAALTLAVAASLLDLPAAALARTLRSDYFSYRDTEELEYEPPTSEEVDR
jgi:cytochrome P450